MSKGALIDFKQKYVANDTIEAFTIEDLKEDGVAMDLTNTSIFMQVRDIDGKIILDLSKDNNKIELISGKTDGITINSFKISKPGIYHFDIQFNFEDGTESTLFYGGFEIISEITQV